MLCHSVEYPWKHKSSEKRRCRLPVKEEVPKDSRKVEPMTSALDASPLDDSLLARAFPTIVPRLAYKLGRISRGECIRGKGGVAIVWITPIIMGYRGGALALL